MTLFCVSWINFYNWYGFSAGTHNYLGMKRNINIIILTFEIAAIVILHMVKLGQAQRQQENASTQGISKTKNSATEIKRYQLLSIK